MAEEKSKVDELSDTLYSRTRYHDPSDKRSTVRDIEKPDVEDNWKTPALDELLSRQRPAAQVTPFMKKFFIFSLLFFIATILIAGFVFLGGVNFVSSKNVDITVVGPTEVSAGDVTELGVTIVNKNNTDLELANFSVQYPQGTRDPEDTSKTLTFAKENLGVIGAGDEVARTVRFVPLGTTGEVKEIKLSVEYKVKGSNATFYKDKVYQVTIGNSPLTISVESPGSVSSGESFTTKIAVTLNSTEVLKNVMLRAEYPYGYSVDSSSPQAVAEDNVWALGDLSPGVTKTIEIKGRLVGEDQDERTMRFYTGVSDNGSLSPTFKTVVLSTQQTIGIRRPSIGMKVSFNGEDAPTYIAPAGQGVAASVKFQNNLPEKVLNPQLEIRFTGSGLNRSSVTAQNGGAYDSSSNRLFWNLTNTQGLRELSPGQDGTVFFSFASNPQITGTNSDIGMELILTGIPVGGGSQVAVRENRSIKIASQVTLSSKATYSIGPFSNTGPIPPKVGEETTYSIIWSLGNTQNELTNAKVTARLGSGVKWVRSASIASEEIEYDEAANTVTWNVENLASGAGFNGPAREVAFQVSLTPSSAQVGGVPVLVSSILFSGINPEASGTLNVSGGSLTTRLSSDPAFIQGDDIVVK